MTTPPTPAGWYPDPDGSGGQRYWDGNLWTEHRYPAAPPPAPPPAPAEPVGPAVPAEPVAPAEPEVSEQPTAIVNLPPAPSEERVGAHRKPDSAPEPTPEPESFTQRTEPVGQRFDFPPATPAPTFGPPSTPPPADPPSFDGYAPPATPPNRKSGLGLWYGLGCAALLAVLVGLAVYGFVIKKDSEVQISSPASTTTEADPTPTDSSETTTESPTTTAGPTTVVPTGDVTDGPLSFTVHGIEIGPTVVMSDAPLENTADGEFVVVHMTVTNVGTDPATFIGMYQTLNAGGTTYPLDDEATAYLEGTFADLAPGQSADVSIAFDVPPGTPPETIELHADPGTPGAEVPLT